MLRKKKVKLLNSEKTKLESNKKIAKNETCNSELALESPANDVTGRNNGRVVQLV